MMPSIIIMIGVLSLVGFSTMLAVSTSQLAALKQTYLQIAHIASKAAFDLAKEEYEADPNYNGTPEEDLVVTTKYRLTIQVDVLSTSGNVKYIHAYGRVYIPEEAGTASFVRDIKGGLVRDGVTVGNPGDYNPLMWLDASDDSTLLAGPASGNSQFISAQAGSGYGSVVEERGSDARRNLGQLVFGDSDLDMAWGGRNYGTQAIGLRFSGLNIPQGATVTDAYIQFTTDETVRAGTIGLAIEAVDSANAPTWNGDYGVSSAAKISTSVDWDPVNWNIVGVSGANERTPSLAPIVQEIVNKPSWNPGSAMAFSISADPLYTGNGHGIRTAESGTSSGSPTLYIEWDISSLGSGSGSTIGEWTDISGNGNDATTASSHGASAPTRVDDQQNGYPVVRFRDEDNSLLLATIPDEDGSALTAFMVAKPLTSSPDLARFLSVMHTSSAVDSNDNNAAAVFYKSNTTGQNSMRTFYNGVGAEYVPSAIDDQFAIYSTRLSSAYVERLRKNGVDNYNGTHNSVSYTINQIFIGGTRTNSTFSNLADVDIAEVIVYDSDLQCSEMYEVELYLAAKWAIGLDSGAGCN
jgi:hypothetical protein